MSDELYTVELIAEGGKRRAIMGETPDHAMAVDMVDELVRQYPYTRVRMRCREYVISDRPGRKFEHQPPEMPQ